MWHPSYTQLATVKPWSMWWSIAQADLAFRAVGWRGHVCEAYTYVSCMIYVPCLVLESYLEEAGSGVTFAHKLVSKIFGGPQKIPQRIRCFFLSPTASRIWRLHAVHRLKGQLVSGGDLRIWLDSLAQASEQGNPIRQWVCLCGYNRVAWCCWIIASVKTWWLVYIWCIWRWLIILQCLTWF